MSTFKKYSKVECYLNGSLMFEAASVKIDRSGNGSPVNSIAGGFTGWAPGAPIQQVSIESNVPADGFEFDLGKAIKNCEEVSLTFYAGGKSMSVTGFCTADGISGGINGDSKVSQSYTTEIGEWIDG